MEAPYQRGAYLCLVSAPAIGLLSPRVLREVGVYWLLYWPLQIVSAVALTVGLLRAPKVVTGVLADVRMYCTPESMVEKAMVQRIDYRVGSAFLQLIGLDWNFRPLPQDQLLDVGGERVSFERVIWVAHSLGTVISYNVLSDLFHHALELKMRGDAEQREGVRRFQRSLRRFVTLGSPLDKAAFLFGRDAIKPWPAGKRDDWLETTGEELGKNQREWWINFYHVLDPVSGSLGSPLVCGAQPPLNLLSGFSASGLVPGLAHMHYWEDSAHTLRYILGRTYGRDYLRDEDYRPFSPLQRMVCVVLGYVVWAVLLLAGAWLIVTYGPEVVEKMWGGVT